MKEEELKTNVDQALNAGVNKDDKDKGNDGRPDPFIPKGGPTVTGSQYEYERPGIENAGTE